MINSVLIPVSSSVCPSVSRSLHFHGQGPQGWECAEPAPLPRHQIPVCSACGFLERHESPRHLAGALGGEDHPLAGVDHRGAKTAQQLLRTGLLSSVSPNSEWNGVSVVSSEGLCGF